MGPLVFPILVPSTMVHLASQRYAETSVGLTGSQAGTMTCLSVFETQQQLVASIDALPDLSLPPVHWLQFEILFP